MCLNGNIQLRVIQDLQNNNWFSKWCFINKPLFYRLENQTTRYTLACLENSISQHISDGQASKCSSHLWFRISTQGYCGDEPGWDTRTVGKERTTAKWALFSMMNLQVQEWWTLCWHSSSSKLMQPAESSLEASSALFHFQVCVYRMEEIQGCTFHHQQAAYTWKNTSWGRKESWTYFYASTFLWRKHLKCLQPLNHSSSIWLPTRRKYRTKVFKLETPCLNNRRRPKQQLHVICL